MKDNKLWATLKAMLGDGGLGEDEVLLDGYPVHGKGHVQLGWTSRGNRVLSEPGTNVLVVGPCRSGKTVNISIPTVLAWEGSTVIVERESSCHVIMERIGDDVQTLILNPRNPETTRFNPLREVITSDNPHCVASLLAMSVLQGRSARSFQLTSEMSSLHIEQAHKAMLGLILHRCVCEGPSTFGAMKHELEEDVRTLLQALEQEPSVHEEHTKESSRILRGNEALVGLLRASLHPWSDPDFAEMTSTSDWAISGIQDPSERTCLCLTYEPWDLDVCGVMTHIITSLLKLSGESKESAHELLICLSEPLQHSPGMGALLSTVPSDTRNSQTWLVLTHGVGFWPCQGADLSTLVKSFPVQVIFRHNSPHEIDTFYRRFLGVKDIRNPRELLVMPTDQVAVFQYGKRALTLKLRPYYLEPHG